MTYSKSSSLGSSGLTTSLLEDSIFIGNTADLATATDTAGQGQILANISTGLTINAGAIVNADVNASAAIAYSKLNLTGALLDADVNASAAIVFTKLLALTASRATETDGSGFIVASSVTSAELAHVSGVTSALQTQLDAKLDDFTSTTDNALMRSDGVLGAAVQDSSIIIDDSDNVSGMGTLGCGTITIGADVNLFRDSANVLRTGDSLIVDGDFTVSGTTTTVDTTNLVVTDANILLNDGAGSAPADDVAGISIERGATGADASLVWNESNNRFSMGLVAGEIDIVDLSSAQTLTTKTLTSPVINTPTGIVKGDVGLGNVDNTSDATKDAATATLTNKTMTRIANTFTRIVTTYSSEQTLSITVDDFVLVSGNTTLNLPAVASSSGVEFTIKKTDSNATTVTLDGNASETIDGATTFAFTEQYESVTIVCDGSAWFVA